MRLPGINYCLVANVIWMIDDFTDTNGATRVVPKSHKIREFAKDGESHKDEILITGKVLLFLMQTYGMGADQIMMEQADGLMHLDTLDGLSNQVSIICVTPHRKFITL